MSKLIAKFKLPAIPPSVNAMYKINYRTKSVYLDESVRAFKNNVFSFIPPIGQIDDQKKLEVFVEYHGIFLNKSDGRTKRKDGQNLDKCLFDIIFEKWGLDDSMAWIGHWKKVHNTEKEFTLVEVFECTE